jgi:hypothetical protein
MIIVPTNEIGVPVDPIFPERPSIIIASQKIMLVFDNMEEYLNFLNPPSPINPEGDIESNETIL